MAVDISRSWSSGCNAVSQTFRRNILSPSTVFQSLNRIHAFLLFEEFGIETEALGWTTANKIIPPAVLFQSNVSTYCK
jgi:hypothetical protein